MECPWDLWTCIENTAGYVMDIQSFYGQQTSRGQFIMLMIISVGLFLVWDHFYGPFKDWSEESARLMAREFPNTQDRARAPTREPTREPTRNTGSHVYSRYPYPRRDPVKKLPREEDPIIHNLYSGEDSKALESSCVICLENTPCCLINPCGHQCLCLDCSHTLVKTLKKCPLCRTPCTSIVYVYT